MKDKDFLAQLEKTTEIINWKLVKRNQKECVWGELKDKNTKLYFRLCPITAVFSQLKGVYRFPISAYPTGKEMGLSQEFVDSIVRAADGEENPERKQLLTTLKL
jgi:hypothetical protein